MPDDIVVKQNNSNLSTYLSENKDTLTILGVFIAVASFGAQLSIKLLAVIISFISLNCATLVSFELWRQKPKGDRYSAPLSVMLFRWLILLLVICFFIYCFIIYFSIYQESLFYLLFFSISEFLFLTLGRFKKIIISKIKNCGFSRALLIAVGIIILIIAYKIAKPLYHILKPLIIEVVLHILLVSSGASGLVFP